MDDVVCAIFLALINVVVEIGVEKILMHMYNMHNSRKLLLILRREIF